jgi:formate hydrogenlyase transcriptional activator
VTETAPRRSGGVRVVEPGNIRELQNVVEPAVDVADGPIVDVGRELSVPAELSQTTPPSPPPPPAGPPPTLVVPTGAGSLEDVQRQHIEATLARSGWIIEGEHGAARQLGIHPNTLRSRMKRLGVSRPRPTAS